MEDEMGIGILGD